MTNRPNSAHVNAMIARVIASQAKREAVISVMERKPPLTPQARNRIFLGLVLCVALAYILYQLITL